MATCDDRISRSEVLEEALVELVRLYDWRKGVGEVITKKQAHRYGQEKKAAWIAAKQALGAGALPSEVPATSQEKSAPRLEAGASALDQIERKSAGTDEPVADAAPEPSVDYARTEASLDSVISARAQVLEEAAQELERTFTECDTLNLLHGAARVRSLKINAAEQGSNEGQVGDQAKPLNPVPASAAPEPAAPQVGRVGDTSLDGERTDYPLADGGVTDPDSVLPVTAAASEAYRRDYYDGWARGLAEGMEKAATLFEGLYYGPYEHPSVTIRAKIKPAKEEL